jgi:hypothetical protein
MHFPTPSRSTAAGLFAPGMPPVSWANRTWNLIETEAPGLGTCLMSRIGNYFPQRVCRY